MGGSWGVIPPPQAPSPCHSVWCVTTSQPHSVPTSEAGYPAAVCKVCVCVCVCVFCGTCVSHSPKSVGEASSSCLSGMCSTPIHSNEWEFCMP